MRRQIFILFLTFIPCTHSNGWGFYAHKTINYAAVFTLPTEMFGFYKTHANLIREMAVNADKRRYILENEAPRHYLDADFYEDVVPLDTIPHHFDSAVSRYGLDTILAHGIVPWHVVSVKWWLTKAFVNKDVQGIIKLSADLGHYVGDLHVPLHSTHNYNGQLTDQHGIHGFWESRLPELFGPDYDLFVGQAEYIDHVDEAIWSAFEESFAAKDSVLMIEKRLSQSLNADKLYSYELRGQSLTKVYSVQYSALYHKALEQMVERRMQSSIKLIGSLWFTAWVDAGQPDLNKLETMRNDTSSDSILLDNKIKGRPESH